MNPRKFRVTFARTVRERAQVQVEAADGPAAEAKARQLVRLAAWVSTNNDLLGMVTVESVRDLGEAS